jgi:predicted phosphohydrolase
MDNFKNIKNYHIGCNDVSDIVLNAIIDTYNWLEKQGQKPAWSEEDESMYTRTLGILGKCYMGELPTKVEEELNWLKSLSPQSHWKPTGEHMEYLAKAIATLGDEGDCKTASILNYLRVELKKLRGE